MVSKIYYILNSFKMACELNKRNDNEENDLEDHFYISATFTNKTERGNALNSFTDGNELIYRIWVRLSDMKCQTSIVSESDHWR